MNPSIKSQIRNNKFANETEALGAMIAQSGITAQTRERISSGAEEMVRLIRSQSRPGLMEVFLAEYGLSSQEGVALMCLAEALLRVPDAETIDALIEDKIAPSAWGAHLGQSSSTLVNASTWALFMTGKVLSEDQGGGVIASLRGAVKRLGEPVIRTAVGRVMKEMGQQFVLGETIEKAMKRAKTRATQGYTHSYDMLGEAARTEEDARRYHLAYSQAIATLAQDCTSRDIRENPGISVKLSALHPRYENLQRDRIMDELVPRARSLALLAKSAGMGFNIDAEEAARLELSLDVIEALLGDPSLKGWDGFGVVVQAYSQRAPFVVDWLYDLACRLDRKIMVRLVKGAYWDTEIKLAQAEGLAGFPVFTRKPSSDVCYLCCAEKLLSMTDRIFPQFATHNAHTVAGVLELATDMDAFEFQRLHGMGEALFDAVMSRETTRCRIYAPVGAHEDLLAYLVRRLLENGANSSFVNQIVDKNVPPAEVVADPFTAAEAYSQDAGNPAIAFPSDIFRPLRANARGWDLSDSAVLAAIDQARGPFHGSHWPQAGQSTFEEVRNPATDVVIGTADFTDEAAVGRVVDGLTPWDAPVAMRAKTLARAADLFEKNHGEIFALLTQEAGKTILDCVGELREAVDFLRYYGAQALRHEGRDPLGVVGCISPWNFPLAIFTGQISAALAAGNAVIAKPAETTPLIARIAVDLLHQAGVPKSALQLVPGQGAIVGAAISANPRVSGIWFTGSTRTAQIINRSMAQHLLPQAPLVAETGGLNAMIVDSTALPEQAVRDIVASAFQSAGQRCSALRVLYVQSEVAPGVLEMLFGAMDELRLGDPWQFSTDIGPVIDVAAQRKIQSHVDAARAEGRLLKQLAAPQIGTFVGPAVLEIDSIADLPEEIFGPVLHVVRFDPGDLDRVTEEINATGFGLTFGLHSRIDDRVQHVIDRITAGNIYVNRNQIGAIVGSQPFGGEGLSGTGPKAGGPNYLSRFYSAEVGKNPNQATSTAGVTAGAVNKAFAELNPQSGVLPQPLVLPGPTGESNRLSFFPKGRVLCLGPGADLAATQLALARSAGCTALAVAPLVSDGLNGVLDPGEIARIDGLEAVIFAGRRRECQAFRIVLSQREGPIVPLVSETDFAERLYTERHVCVDTTAAGGNAALLAASQ